MRENPFALGNANRPGTPRDSFAAEAEAAFRQFVLRPEFPCVGAKAALNSSSYTVGVYSELGSDYAAGELAPALYYFARSTRQTDPHPSLLPQGKRTDLSEEHRYHSANGLPGDSGSALAGDSGDALAGEIPLPEGEGRVNVTSEYATFVAIFEQPRELDEIEFEDLLWKQLRSLHQYDAAHFDWDQTVRSDPADPHFSFSFGGQALYVIGLHSNSSREARRFPWPALVFNSHEQFERLRADGKWKRMQETIRSRDFALQGTINPMLSDFGQQSEARQYSGRAVEDDWEAPFPKVAGKCPFAHGP